MESPADVPDMPLKIPKESLHGETPKPRISPKTRKTGVGVTTLAVSKTFAHFPVSAIDDDKMAGWVRNLAIELVKRLIYDRHRVV